MKATKRRPTTVYLIPELAKAIKVQAALNGMSVSDIVNDALTQRLRQDEDDIRLMRERRKQPTRSYEEVLKDLKRDGLI